MTAHRISINVEESLSRLTRPSALQSSNPSRNASATNEGGIGQFCWFSPQTGCRSNVPSAIGKQRAQVVYWHP